MTLRVLIVEDEPMLALDLERELADSGLEVVGIATSVEKGIQQVHALEIDVAVLDLNLHDESSAPIAHALRERGIPFIFVSGYRRDAVPPGFENVPLMPKPFETAALVGVLHKSQLRLPA